MSDNQVEQAVDVGGSAYTVLYNPNLSVEARSEINQNVSKSSSGDNTDIYDMDAVLYALDNDLLSVSEQDSKVLKAIEQGYIEIK